MREILELVYAPRAKWGDVEAVRAAFSDALRERYLRVPDLRDKKNNDERRFQLRVNGNVDAGSVPYAALIAPDQEPSGGYGGMSFVVFPSDDDGSPALVAMVVGTNGLAPDEAVLGRPGHARKCAAIAAWLNSAMPSSAWAKRDPVRIDLDLPRALSQSLAPWNAAAKKYGKVIYATFVPPTKRTKASDEITLDAITAFVDLFFDERRIDVKKPAQESAERIRREWMTRILPSTTAADVRKLLERRRYAIIEGPPGTGETRLADELLKAYGRGRVIQFHPGTTYESFVGGLAPRDGGTLGFTFQPTAGHLMEAATEAARDPKRPYLLVVDEINRADLAKVLGEAIYLFEPAETERVITLAHDFPGHGRTLKLPPNLHVLGTMNSADRSIAILDVAIRRRFAFVPMWPQLRVVEDQKEANVLATRFHELLSLFVEHASDDALALVPGHAYFLGHDEVAATRLSTELRPLLEEYLAQGYVAGFADEVRAYLDRIQQGT